MQTSKENLFNTVRHRDDEVPLLLTLRVLLQQGEFSRGQCDPFVLAAHRVQASLRRPTSIPRAAPHGRTSHAGENIRHQILHLLH